MAHRVSAATCPDAMPRQRRSTSTPSMAGSRAVIREKLESIDAALLENWALSYLGRFASSAENLRRLLRRRARRLGPDMASAADAPIDALIARYLAAGLLDDAAYARAR